MARQKHTRQDVSSNHTARNIAAVALIVVIILALSFDGSWLDIFTTTAIKSSTVNTEKSKGSVIQRRGTVPQKGGDVTAKRKAGKGTPQGKGDKDEVAMTEYHFEGINTTLQMKQNWWHSHEKAAGKDLSRDTVNYFSDWH